jgi:hypothetical protein
MLCGPCGRSYDRARSRDDGTIFSAIAWAAARARREERKRSRREAARLSLTPLQLADVIACVEHARDAVGERYAWKGDPEVARTKAFRTRLLRKLRGAP